MFFPVVIVVFVLNLTPFYCVLFILHFQLLRCAARRQFFPTFSGNGNIFFATHLTFLIRSSPLRPGESISIWLFSIFPLSIFSFRRILCSFWFVSIRFFLYKFRYLCKCLPVVPCLCFCGASIWVVFSSYVFYFEGKSLKRRHAADILRICQVKVRVVCLCFYLHFTILLLALPISKRRKIFHSFVAYFRVRECCFLIYRFTYTWINIFQLAAALEFPSAFVYFALRWKCNLICHSRHWPWKVFGVLDFRSKNAAIILYVPFWMNRKCVIKDEW